MTHHTAVLEQITKIESGVERIQAIIDKVKAAHHAESGDAHDAHDLQKDDQRAFRDAVLPIVDTILLEAHTLQQELTSLKPKPT